MSRTRIATAVLLTRGDGPELEVFVARRAEELRFFGGYWAFLGGVVEEVDHDGDPDDDAAHLRCAQRELFEEAGIAHPDLLADLGDQAEAVRAELLERGPTPASWRERVERRPSALDPLRAFARLTTPPFAPVRYRTRFVHCALPAGQEARIVPGELVALLFESAGRRFKTRGAGEGASAIA